MNPRVKREPADIAAESLTIIFEKLWQQSEVSSSWKTSQVESKT